MVSGCDFDSRKSLFTAFFDDISASVYRRLSDSIFVARVDTFLMKVDREDKSFEPEYKSHAQLSSGLLLYVVL